MRKKTFWFFLAVFCVTSAFSQSETENNNDKLDRLNLSVSGNANIMFGQIRSGYEYGRLNKQDDRISKRWMNGYSGRLEVKSQPTDWYYTNIALEIGSNFPITLASAIQKESFRLSFKPSLPKAVGVFDFKFDAWSLLIESGIMEYAFNPEVKNLGNYMYRSTSYPFTLKTKIDYIYSNLMGIRTEGKFFSDQLKAELILNSILDQYPFFDFSLGAMLSYTTPNKFFTIGEGICFDRLFSVDKEATDVKTLKSNLTDSTITFRSVKLDSRLTLDFRQLLNNPDIMSKNDFKLYFETAIVGLKDPKYYPNADTTITPSAANRMPFLFGVNIPTFKILDILSFEVEYCNSPYSNDWWGGMDGSPSPEPNNVFGTDSVWDHTYKELDNFKWTLYLKKSISKFDIIFFFANDHIFYETRSAENQAYTEQSLRTEKDKHWYLKLQYNL